MKQQGTGGKTQGQAGSRLAEEDTGSQANEIECRAGVEGKSRLVENKKKNKR